MSPGAAEELGLHVEAVLMVAGPLALTWSLTFASHLLRYVISGGAVAALIRLPVLEQERLQAYVPGDPQRRQEYRASLMAGAIFAAQTLFVTAAMAAGWTQVYYDAGRFGVGYQFASFGLALLIHDAYFYWTHRWMHRPRVFERLHLHHHQSQTPTVWTAFSFHPWKAS